MRLAIYTLLRNSSWGGSENLWYKTVLLALVQNHQVLVIVHQNLADNKQIIELKNKGVEIFICNDILTNLIDKLLNKISEAYSKRYLLKNLIKAVEDFKPNFTLINQPGGYDILYSHENLKLLLKSRNFGVLTHSYSHYDLLTSTQKNRMKEILNAANKLFFVAKKQSIYINTYLGIENAAQEVISNPLNIKEKKLIGYPNDNPRKIKMAMVTTLFFASKGIDMLVTILSKPYFKNKDWQLEIYGSGPDEIELSKLILDKKLEDKIKLMGYANQIEAIWTDNQILIMPSRVDAAPSVLLEAMSCGRTTVCTNVGFCDEWINDGVNGFISKSTDEADFQDSLMKAFDQHHKWQEMGRNCYDLVNKLHPKEPEYIFLEKLILASESEYKSTS